MSVLMQGPAETDLRRSNNIVLPLAIKPIRGGLKIVDCGGHAIAWIYTDEDARRRSSADLLEPEDAERIAKICARALTAALQQRETG